MSKKSSKSELRRLRLLIEDSPLSEYRKDLLIRIDVQGKTVIQVARDLGKAKSTISSQHKRAFEEFESWRKGSAPKAGSEDLDALIFQRFNSGRLPNEIIAEYGRATHVKSLYQVWKEMEADDLSQTVRWLRDYGALEDSGDGVNRGKLIFDGVCKLIDMVNQAEWRKQDVEKKLAEYENTVGTVKMLERRRQSLENNVRELTPIVDRLQKEYLGLLTKNGNLKRNIKEAEYKYDALLRKIEQLEEKLEETKMRCGIFQAQLRDLQENLRHYRKEHGMNIKVGDLICKKNNPDILYIVIGESEDKNSWMAKVFDSSRLAEVAEKQGIPIRDVEGPLLKKEAIENWVVVDLSENLNFKT